MNALMPFAFESHAIRVVMVDGEPWFVGKDVAIALDYVWNSIDCIRHIRGLKSNGTETYANPYVSNISKLCGHQISA